MKKKLPLINLILYQLIWVLVFYYVILLGFDIFLFGIINYFLKAGILIILALGTAFLLSIIKPTSLSPRRGKTKDVFFFLIIIGPAYIFGLAYHYSFSVAFIIALSFGGIIFLNRKYLFQ